MRVHLDQDGHSKPMTNRSPVPLLLMPQPYGVLRCGRRYWNTAERQETNVQLRCTRWNRVRLRVTEVRWQRLYLT